MPVTLHRYIALAELIVNLVKNECNYQRKFAYSNYRSFMSLAEDNISVSELYYPKR